MPFQPGKSGNPKGRKKLEGPLLDVKLLAQKHCTAAIHGLAEIASDEKCDPRARVQAMNSLLDRGFGKPHQSVSQENTHRYIGEELIIVRKAGDGTPKT